MGSTGVPFIEKTHSHSYAAISPTRPELSTKGKSALITGAGTGIGASIAKSFAKSGIANIAIFGRTVSRLEDTKKAISSLNPEVKVSIYSVDITDLEATTKAVNDFATIVPHGKIDIVVGNAGTMCDLDAITKVNAKDWWFDVEVFIKGNFNIIRAIDPHVGPGAAIIHMSSAAIHLPYLPGFSSYRVAKVAATKLFEYYGCERPDVHVVHLHPGLIGGTVASAKFEEDVKKWGVPFDDVGLSGDFTVWAASEEARFLRDRLVYATWDVDELKSKKAELEADPWKLTMGLMGVGR